MARILRSRHFFPYLSSIVGANKITRPFCSATVSAKPPYEPLLNDETSPLPPSSSPPTAPARRSWSLFKFGAIAALTGVVGAAGYAIYEIIKQREAKSGSLSKNEAQDQASHILLLRADMQKAIDSENYDVAAQLRDEIMKLEAKSLAASAIALANANVQCAFRFGQKVKHKIFVPEENLLATEEPARDRFHHPYLSFLFYGMDTAGDFIPIKQLLEKYGRPSHEVPT